MRPAHVNDTPSPRDLPRFSRPFAKPGAAPSFRRCTGQSPFSKRPEKGDSPFRAALALALAAAALLAATALGPLPAASAATATPSAAVGFERPELEKPALRTLGIPQIVLLLLFAAAVFYVMNWAFLDTRFVGTNQPLWNGVVLGAGVVGLLAALLVPLFYLGLPLGIVIFAGAAVSYAVHRNTMVTPRLTVLSRAHLERLKKRLSGIRVTEEVGPVTGVGRDIVFMGLDDLPIRLEADSPVRAQANGEVERILFDAIVRRASMVGLLVRGTKAQVRLRIDGQVADGGEVERPVSEHVAAAVKQLAGLDAAEVRRPQEGRARAVVAGQTFELRIRTSGSVRGEQVAVRVIDLARSQMRLEDLGFSDEQLQTLSDGLGRRPGLVVVSGPKDSGLTTTLHACLRSYDRYMSTVIIFEPHVDLEVENVQHHALSQEDGAAAAQEVLGHVRMEPDVVAVDSLSSPEVARVLTRTAEEHRVLLGLRATDASQALARVAELLGSTALLAKHLHLVANQRLVRRLCPDCKEAYRPNPDFLRKANLAREKVDLLYRPPMHVQMEKGKPVVCPRCRNVRYVGRTGLFELMPIDEEARALIGRGAGVADVRTHARKLGMRNLQEEGLRLVIGGDTSIEEVLRAIKQAR